MPPKPTIDPGEAAARRKLERVEGLIEQARGFKDPAVLEHTKELVQALMDFHGAAVEKIFDRIASSSESGVPLIDSLAADKTISSLLLLYNLHPLELEERVEKALEKARPYLLSHGGNVELLRITEGEVFLRLQGSCHGCPSSAVTLKQTIEEAMNDFAPDAAAIHVEEEPAADSPAVGGLHSPKHAVALPILAG